jgi:hypothetical protein
MDKLDIVDRTPPIENQHGPQIRQREQRGPDQQIRPPFQEIMLMKGKK